MSRREREEHRQRMVILGVVVAGVLLVGILAAGAIYQYLYLPNQTLASVNGVEIKRADYWKMRKLELLNQVQQYSQIAQLTQGEQSVQYQQLAEQALAQLDSVESDPVESTTVSQMVDDQVVLQRLDTLGLSVTDADVEQTMEQFFSPQPSASPTPTLGVDPTAAAWATATAEAQVTPTPESTPEATPEATEGAGAATPSASPTAENGNEGASNGGTPEAAADATPEATPGGTPTPTPTLSPDAVQATATATFQQYKRNVLDEAGMSEADFRRLVVLPEAARQKVAYELQEKIPTRAEQVHAAHILVATEDAAKAIEEQLRQGADFAQLAKEQSADSSTAVNGGDLGWFPRGLMVKPFEDVAFSLEPGQVSAPVQTQFGWHIIKVFEKEADRPVDVSTLQTLRNQQFSKWLEEQRAAVTIRWEIPAPAPTPEPSEFVPPPDAPPTPTPTPSPTPTLPPSATPGTDEATPEPTATP
ncbi:peptidylprolyl isomerase [Sphaerobacter sp.]|uniref:peptidylprolyl isomerase n=1 Tax=Sphaerobacter sp. TaxID=2099654 RepID=UPI001E0A9F6A|nr:peptidylprolyl isomerase [Sphaerobacter sp.]MBX5445108.1 peptidylprolyl isomerase [Sphaerobacter sp.]